MSSKLPKLKVPKGPSSTAKLPSGGFGSKAKNAFAKVLAGTKVKPKKAKKGAYAFSPKPVLAPSPAKMPTKPKPPARAAGTKPKLAIF